jgi:hypothetical protein
VEALGQVQQARLVVDRQDSYPKSVSMSILDAGPDVPVFCPPMVNVMVKECTIEVEVSKGVITRGISKSNGQRRGILASGSRQNLSEACSPALDVATCTAPRSDLGQGCRTTLALGFADNIPRLQHLGGARFVPQLSVTRLHRSSMKLRT